MAGKASAFASRELFITLEALTKNQLIDLIVDVARHSIRNRSALPTASADDATDPAIIAWIQPRIESVWNARGDSRIDLMNRYNVYSPNKPTAKKYGPTPKIYER